MTYEHVCKRSKLRGEAGSERSKAGQGGPASVLVSADQRVVTRQGRCSVIPWPDVSTLTNEIPSIDPGPGKNPTRSGGTPFRRPPDPTINPSFTDTITGPGARSDDRFIIGLS